MSEYDKSLPLIFRADLPLSFQPTHVNKSKLQKKKKKKKLQQLNFYQFLCNHQSVESTAQLRQLSKILILLVMKLKWFSVQIKIHFKIKCVLSKYLTVCILNINGLYWIWKNMNTFNTYYMFCTVLSGKMQDLSNLFQPCYIIFSHLKNNVIIILTYLQKWHLQSLFDHVDQTEYWR